MSVDYDFCFPHEPNPYFQFTCKVTQQTHLKLEPLSAIDRSYIVFDFGGCEIFQKQQWVNSPKAYIRPAREFLIFSKKPKGSYYYVVISHQLSFYQLTGRNASEYQDHPLPLDEVFGAEKVDHVYQQLQKVKSTAQASGLVFDFLSENVRELRITPIDEIVQTIVDVDGLISHDDIIRRSKCSKRTLNRYFNQYIGMSPALFIRLVKFNMLIKKLTCNEPIKELIYQYDFFDHAHLTKDFLRFAHVKPTEYFGPNYQSLRDALKPR